MKDEKNVLIRLFKDNHNDFMNNESYLLKWIDINKLKVNLTLPRHN